MPLPATVAILAAIAHASTVAFSFGEYYPVGWSQLMIPIEWEYCYKGVRFRILTSGKVRLLSVARRRIVMDSMKQFLRKEIAG